MLSFVYSRFLLLNPKVPVCVNAQCEIPHDGLTSKREKSFVEGKTQFRLKLNRVCKHMCCLEKA